MKLDGVPERVVLKDMQRHVYKPAIHHMDFLRISESEMITMRVPIHFINEETCVAVKTSGAVISHLISDIEVTCLPKDLPEYITVDLQPLNVGDSVHVNELVLPPGVQVASLLHGGDAHQAVVSVHAARGGAGEEGAA
jgi:large subunit ribosomal protein L25